MPKAKIQNNIFLATINKLMDYFDYANILPADSKLEQ